MTQFNEFVATVAAQNDAFRRHVCADLPFPEGTARLEGRLEVADAVRGCGPAFVRRCLEAIAAPADLPDGHDPSRFRSCGSVEVDGREIRFKIVVYDPDYRFGSNDMDRPSVSARVLTVMLPGEN